MLSLFLKPEILPKTACIRYVFTPFISFTFFTLSAYSSEIEGESAPPLAMHRVYRR